MQMYFTGTGIISPQHTFEKNDSDEIVIHSGSRMNCIEPDYKSLIDAKSIRRMSKIIRMGTAASMRCLSEAKTNLPDAIVTATGYGCLEDTTVFLKKMVENNEEMLAPAAFIQSTHNSVGAQIALLLKCNNYNNTFT